MKILIAAGGTGGHIFPALVIAQDLIAKGHEVRWVGTKHGLESEIIPAHKITIYWIKVFGLRRVGLLRKVLAPFFLSIALLQVIKIFFNYRPEAVLGMGGYVTGPVGLVARLFRCPLYIHEANSIAGYTNKILARFAHTVFAAFPKSFPAKVKRLKLVGNPVRDNIYAIIEPSVRMGQIANVTELKILVLGGSRGAIVINEAVTQALRLWGKTNTPKIWHQSGKHGYEDTLTAYYQLNLEAKVEPFIEDMAKAYAWADLVICRAGALTVSELCAAGCASILVPYPYAVDDHQTENAQFLAKSAAGILFPQNKFSAPKLMALLKQLQSDRKQILNMALNARKLAQFGTKDKITAAIVKG